MNSIGNHMGKYDHRQHVLSDWLAELEQRFQLGEVNTDKAKITWCQLLIGATGSSILAGLEDDATWEAAEETLLSRLGAGSVRDEAWASLKQLKRGSKEIIELAGEAEKLAKHLHPRDEEAAERHVFDAFLGALNRPLAVEVQKLGCRTMEEVVAAARRIERILEERPTSGLEQLIQSMQSQIQILTKDLAKAHEQMASKAPAATPTAAFAAPPSNAVVAAQPPPAASASTSLPSPASTPLPPLATAQPPLYNPGRPPYFDYGEEGSYFHSQRRQPDRRPPRCFLWVEEGHFAYRCPDRTILQRLLRQQAQETARGLPRGQILELPAPEGSQGSPQGHLNFIVIVGLESPPCLIGMDIMRPLSVHIDVTNCTAMPAQPDPQTVHLNAAQSQQRRQEKPLPGTGLPFSQVTGPPPAPPPQGGKPLPEANSPASRPASPPQILQPREGTPSPRAPLLLGGTADSSRIQPQRKEMPLPGAGMPAPPPPEIPHPAAASPSEFPPRAPLSTAPPCPATPHTASCARLLQTEDIPPETARLVCCHNPWPTEDVLFWPNDALPAFVTGIPALSSGLELWIAVHNHRPEPLQLHSGQNIGVLEVVTLADSPATTSPAFSHPQTPCHQPLPERLSPLQQQQLNELFREFSDVFS